MKDEFTLLADIKQRFDWPIDMLRYGLGGKNRFVNAAKAPIELGEEVSEKMRFSLRKTKIAQRLIRYLTMLPWVQMVFITGSVASLNAKEDDDIDLWVVVSAQRIWMTRAFDFFLYTLLGKRRLAIDGVETHRVTDKLCFNFYTTTDAPKLPAESVSFAMQFIDSIPLFIRDFRHYGRLLAENRWITKYFPSWYHRAATWATQLASYKSESDVAQRTFSLLEKVFAPLISLLDYIAGVLMIAKAEKKLSLRPSTVFRSVFTTWGTPRILSQYDIETITESGQEGK